MNKSYRPAYKTRVSMSVSFPIDKLYILDELAHENAVSRSDFVCQAVLEKIAKIQRHNDEKTA